MVEKIDFVVYLRCFAIILVIIGHSLAIYTSFWGFHVSPIHNTIWRYVVYIVYAIHMPIFSLIAGYLYILIRKNGGYDSYGLLISKKVKRLLVPLLFWGFFECTIDLNCDYSEFLFGPLHLWYLRFLLMCFLITYLFDKWLIKTPWVIIPILFLFFLKNMFLKDLFSDVFFIYYPYFIIGIGLQVVTSGKNNYRNIIYIFWGCSLFFYCMFSVTNKFDGLLSGFILNISIFLACWTSKLPPPQKNGYIV